MGMTWWCLRGELCVCSVVQWQSSTVTGRRGSRLPVLTGHGLATVDCLPCSSLFRYSFVASLAVAQPIRQHHQPDHSLNQSRPSPAQPSLQPWTLP
jgi:hypothetical protein